MSKVKSPPPLADQAERDRITRELDRSLLVEAGAGSGKTHELASRMAAGIASGAYEIDKMAAVTFTRKAAAELRGRFQLALEEQLRSDDRSPGPSGPGTPDLFTAASDRIRDALANIERFFAGTIHSFCARLLRERPVEAGVAPGFTELDDAEDALLREQSWRDYRSQAMAGGDPDFRLLDEAGVKARQLDDAFKVVCLYEEVDFPPGDATMPDDKAAWKALEAFWSQLAPYVPSRIDPDTSCRTQQSIDRFTRDWDFFQRNGKLGTGRSPAMLASLLGHWDFTPKITQNRWSDDKAEKKKLGALIPDLHEAFRAATVTPYLTAWREYLYGIAVKVLVKARARAADDRRRRNVLSFNDLLARTAEVLRANADVRCAMQQKYRWLFVDEFQDTDPIQAEIIFLLAGEEPRTANREPRTGIADWRTLPIRPGALFVVGDPKQSIYRFTRADIDIYNQVRALLAGPGDAGIVTLTTNFRSVPGLCGWANEVFEVLFPKEPTDESPRFAPLVAVRDNWGPHPGGPHLEVRPLRTLTIPSDSDDGVADEADRIARFVRSEVDAGRRTFGDFLVLTRRKKDLQVYADALERRRVPVEVSGGSGFSESEEVRQLALLLMALTDPQDQVALVGVLRGALFGLSDRELFAWRQRGGWFSIFAHAAGESASTASAGVGAALARLRTWHGWTRMLPAGAALERILDDSGYLALAASSPGGVDAGDLLHAVDRVRAVVETGFTLSEAAQALASWSKLDEDGPEESSEAESLPLESGRRDVVRVMNLHKAKGLEAPVVFLADPTGGFEPRVDVRIIRPRDARVGTLGYFQIREQGRFGPGRAIAQPAGWDRLHAEEKAYLDAEQTRLLYVAATRAKDVLVVSRWARGGRFTPAWAELESHLAGATELVIPDGVEDAPPPVLDLSAAASAKAARAAEFAHGAAVKSSWAATSVTAEAKRFPTITPAGRDDVQPDAGDPTRSVAEDTPSRRADAGIAWGSLIHGLLEHAMRHSSATRDDLRRLAMWLTVEEPQLRVVIDQALDSVEAVKGAEFWQEARASAEAHEEAPFAVRRDDGGKPTVVSGAIDLVHRVGDGWRVVDYKTDVDAGEGELRRRYDAQLAAYVEAWRRVSGAAAGFAIVGTREAGDG
jgi:ATP-dependent helicase/nuclease subunit A